MSQRSNQQNITMRHTFGGGAKNAPGILLRTEGILLRTGKTGPWGQEKDPRGDYNVL